MKTLVAFYSRTGNTKQVGEEIAKNLDADIDEIVDLKNRKGTIPWIIAGKDAATKKTTEIKSDKKPDTYDLVIIGTPIWAGTVTPAIRTYLSNNKFNNIAFFCTCGDIQRRAFTEMEQLSRKPQAILELKQRTINETVSREKIKDFCEKIGNQS